VCEMSRQAVEGFATIEICRSKENMADECIVRDVQIFGKKYQGKILIGNFKLLNVLPGSRIAFSGSLEEGKKYSDFDYGRYLRKDGIYGIVRPDGVEILRSGDESAGVAQILNKLKNLLFFLCRKIELSLVQNFSGNVLGLIEGLLIGNTDHFSEETKETFRSTGIYHIVAVSGSHIVMISELILPFFFLAGFPKSQAYLLTIGVLFCFVLLIGWPASAGRAWVMGAFVFASQISGRQRKTNNILLFTASLVLLGNPLLIHDIGFQLSCASVFGLVNISPVIEKILSRQAVPGIFLKTTAGTLAAQIGTLPLTLYHFHTFSLISPFANLLVLWIIPLLTLGGMAYLALSVLSWRLAALIAFPLSLGAQYVLKISDLLGSISWANIVVVEPRLGWIIAGILIILILLPRCRSSEF